MIEGLSWDVYFSFVFWYMYIYIYIYFLTLNRINFGQRSTLRGAVTIMINSSKISIHRFIVLCGQRMATLIRQNSRSG